MSAAPREELRIDGRTVVLSRPDKVLFPAAGFTKRDLVAYYLAIAPVLLPHLAGRAITLARFPDGVDAPYWFQSNCPAGRPDWLPVAEQAGTRGQRLRYCRLEEPAALAWAANTGAIELHPFLARVERPDAPTALVLDLDPTPPADVLDAARVALSARALLQRTGLVVFAKTSGAKGVHVLVPLDGTQTFDETKAFARALAEQLALADPGRVTARMGREGREGKVLVDWRQNAAGLSTVAPYSLRGTPLPGVSTPIRWEELERAAAGTSAEALRFSPADVLARVEREGDLLLAARHGAQRLPLAG